MKRQMNIEPLRRASVTRYVTPLREGGSLPALAEADDGFKYVVKFKGGGHGTRALIAETIGAEVARLVGLRIPEMVLLDLDEDFGRTEGDEEIQDLLRASRGLNVGMHFLSGALTWDPAVNKTDAMTASQIVWLDSMLTNVDRSALNTNMLLWNRELWLIDFGASLLFQHNFETWEKAAESPFTYIERHALLREASLLDEVDALMHERITDEDLEKVVDLVPAEWMDFDNVDLSPEQVRDVYKKYLITRFHNSRKFVDYANGIRSKK